MEVLEEAHRLLVSGVEALPEQPGIRRNLSWVLAKLGQSEAAKSQLRRARLLEAGRLGWTEQAWAQVGDVDHNVPAQLEVLRWDDDDYRWETPETRTAPSSEMVALLARAKARLGLSARGECYSMRKPVSPAKLAVFEGDRDTLLERSVTITSFLDSNGCDTEWLSKIAGRWACLPPHPHIVPIYDFASHGEVHYIVSEPVNGPSLQELLSRQTRPGPCLAPAVFRDLVAGLASALYHAHSHRVLHGALSADAVVLVPHGPVKLLRFAPEHLSSLLEGGGHHPAPSTLFCKAPDQLWGQATVASDLYAFGMLLYQAMGGALPFDRSKPAELYHESQSMVPPKLAVPRGYPDGTADTIARCLAKEPSERPSALAVLKALYPDTVVDTVDWTLQLRLYRQAEHSMERQHFDQAIEDWRLALQMDPLDGTAANNLAAALTRVGASEEAEELFRKACRLLSPNHAGIQLNLGWLLWKLARLNEAETALRKAACLNPRCAEAYHFLGLCLGDAEAIQEFQKALMINPTSSQTRLALAQAYQRSGQEEQANRYREQALQLVEIGLAEPDFWPRIFSRAPDDTWEGGSDWPLEGRGGGDPPSPPDGGGPDDDGRAGVPLRRRPVTPAASAAAEWPVNPS
jgi:serine/threonine protein kinase